MKIAGLILFFFMTSIAFQNCAQQTDFNSVGSDEYASDGDNDGNEPIEITLFPQSAAVSTGGMVILSVNARSLTGKPLSFQWFKNGIMVSGATSRTLSMYSATVNDSGYYTVDISDGEEVIETPPVQVVVSAVVGTISFSRLPSSAVVTVGGSVTLSALASDSSGATISYQWLFNGNPINAATSADYVISNAAKANEGYYSVRAISTSNTFTSPSIFVTVNTATQTCVGGQAYGGHCYKITANSTFAAAQATCTGMGGYVVKINDVNENYFVNMYTGGAIYIGATDDVTEGVWRWRDGSGLTYAPWYYGEPNNSGNEDCAVMRADGYWNDGQCTSSLRAVCEIE